LENSDPRQATGRTRPPRPAKVFGLEWVAFAFAVSFEGWPDI